MNEVTRLAAKAAASPERQAAQRPVARCSCLRPPASALVARPGLIEGDEPQHREEGHLEARLDRGFRLEQQDHDGCQGEVAHRQRRPVDHDGEEHDRHHDEGALPWPRRQSASSM